ISQHNSYSSQSYPYVQRSTISSPYNEIDNRANVMRDVANEFNRETEENRRFDMNRDIYDDNIYL
ncbi:unnamed protein product, partial [Rotaria sp. Silwood1]